MRFPAPIVSFIVGIGLFLSILTPAFAQTTNPYSSLINANPDVPINLSTISQGVILGMVSSATCILGGIDFLSPRHQCLGYDPQTGKLGYSNSSEGGILGIASGGITMIYTSPFPNTSDYVHYLSSSFGLVKKADAASGFEQLSPLMNLWITFRNISYMLFVVIFVVIGFAIMMRAKIDPRTVMTVENQLPKIVIALILISFSFAIAGLMIDVMWVSVYVVINLFASLDPQLHQQLGSITSSASGNIFGFLNTLNSGFGGFLGIPSQAAGGIRDIADVIAFGIFQKVGFLKIFLFSLFGLPTLIGCTIAAALSGAGHAIDQTIANIPGFGGVYDVGKYIFGGSGSAATQSHPHPISDLGACMDAGMASIVSNIVDAIAFIIFTIAMIIALIRLFWQLLKAYSLFLIYVIFGPVMIIAGIIPGSKTNFDNWIKHVIAYLAVFPTTIAIFLLGKVLMDLYGSNHAGGFAPPLIGITSTLSTFVGPLLGFALIMLAPQALTMVQDALTAPDIKYLPGIGQMMNAGTQAYTTLVSQPWKSAMRHRDWATGRSEGWLRTRINNINVPFTSKKVGELMGYKVNEK